MWNKSEIEREDLESARLDPAIDWEKLKGKTVLVTGATGLIGQGIAKTLLYVGNIRVIAPVRNPEKAKRIFASQLENGLPILFPVWEAEVPLSVKEDVDYIFHCANQTSSQGFVQTPADTIHTAYSGTHHVLSFAKEKGVKKVVYLSTMEVYGTPQTDEKITETHVGVIDPLNVRNCYPESKRLCESLCVSFASQHQVPVCIARLTQTFGPGIDPSDRRVFADFARCVMEKRNIVLHTKGETKRNYLYTADATRALILLALEGKSGEAYNLANEDTYCTIYEMAQTVAREIAGGAIEVCVEVEEDLGKFGYAPVLHMNLDTKKMRGLGWKPQRGLCDMFRRMIASFER